MTGLHVINVQLGQGSCNRLTGLSNEESGRVRLTKLSNKESGRVRYQLSDSWQTAGRQFQM